MGGLLLKLQNFKKVKLIFGHPVRLHFLEKNEQKWNLTDRNFGLCLRFQHVILALFFTLCNCT